MHPYLRDSLIPGLTQALVKNKPNKDLLGLKEIKLFEIGTVWKGGKEVVMLGSITEKNPATEQPLPAIQGLPLEYDALPLSDTARFEPFSKYPYMVRDIALWVPAGTDVLMVETRLCESAGPLAARVMPFDRFEKEGRVSLAFRIIFQSPERTLTEPEVAEAMVRVAEAVRAQGYEVR